MSLFSSPAGSMKDPVKENLKEQIKYWKEKYLRYCWKKEDETKYIKIICNLYWRK